MKWKILNGFEFSKKNFDLEKLIEILLENRGIKTEDEKELFLNPKKTIDFSAKDLGIDEKEVKKAINKINEIIEKNKSIIVYGDYDADGICATSILWETLYKQYKNVLPYIPQRNSEGYGLNCDSILKLKDQNPNLGLIITVDHGITGHEKIEYAKSLGIEVIICDHHQVGLIVPDCAAILHTEEICGTAISWYLSERIQGSGSSEQSIINNLPTTNHQSPITNYLDLVAIATIADLEILTGPNRSFVKEGLEAINKTKRFGLLAIIEEAGLTIGEIGVYEIGYIIAPRLNAMGRMDHALQSLRLLCTPNEEKARELAGILGTTNKDRQNVTLETVKIARALFLTEFPKEIPKFIFISDKSFNEGIIGLVAGRLTEEFYRPSIIISIGEEFSKASARSISGFNIIEAIREHKELIVDAGGHPMAAGFTIETIKISLLKEKLLELSDKNISNDLLEKITKADVSLPLNLVSKNLYEKIQNLSPFGQGNQEPTFFIKTKVVSFKPVGKEGKHLKLMLGDDKAVFNAVYFNAGSQIEKLKIGEEIEIAYNLSMNNWNGNSNLELRIKNLNSN